LIFWRITDQTNHGSGMIEMDYFRQTV